MNNSEAFIAGRQAAETGTHINNCWPYTKGQEYQDWLSGYRSIVPNAEEDELGKALRDLGKKMLTGTPDDYLD